MEWKVIEYIKLLKEFSKRDIFINDYLFKTTGLNKETLCKKTKETLWNILEIYEKKTNSAVENGFTHTLLL